MIHDLHPALQHALERTHAPIEVHLVGAGGNGSKLLMGLRSLHEALRAFGSAGLHVKLFDPDVVSESNLARQAFYASDLGLPKATVLIHRLNLACGLDWTAHPRKATEKDVAGCHILVNSPRRERRGFGRNT